MKILIHTIFILLAICSFSQTQTGKASFYADQFEGRPTASGELYKHNLATAAHRKLPFGTKVKVTNLENNQSAVVKINDRGPFIRGRIIDLSQSVAKTLGIIENGISEVQIEVLDANAEVSDTSSIYNSENSEQTPHSTKAVSEQALTTSENFVATSKSEQSEDEFYMLDVDKIQPDFYGVQVASFSESDNLIRLANQLKINYKSKVIIQVKTINQRKVYTAILGQFDNRIAAEKFRDQNLEKYPDAFIVNMTNN